MRYTNRRLLAAAAVASVPLGLFVIVACACPAAASDGNGDKTAGGCVVDQTNEDRTDPNPHQPKPPDPICDYEFIAAWTSIPPSSDGVLRGVHWTFKAGGKTWYGGSRGAYHKPDAFNRTGSWQEIHRGVSCLHAASITVSAVSGVGDHGNLACKVTNLTQGRHDPDETRAGENRSANCFLGK